MLSPEHLDSPAVDAAMDRHEGHAFFTLSLGYFEEEFGRHLYGSAVFLDGEGEGLVKRHRPDGKVNVIHYGTSDRSDISAHTQIHQGVCSVLFGGLSFFDFHPDVGNVGRGPY